MKVLKMLWPMGAQFTCQRCGEVLEVETPEDFSFISLASRDAAAVKCPCCGLTTTIERPKEKAKEEKPTEDPKAELKQDVIREPSNEPEKPKPAIGKAKG